MQNSAIKGAVADAEERVERLYRRYKDVLPVVGRLFLVSTFIDDGLRMILQWQDQFYFFSRRFWEPVVIFILVFNFLVQLAASLLILARKFSAPSVYSLFFIIFLQTGLYYPLWSWQFFARNLALCGTLILLLADARTNWSKKDFAGVPSLGNEDSTKSYMLFTGRILVVCMFFTLIHSDMSPLRWILAMLNFGLIVCVAVGAQAKLAAFVLVSILLVENMTMNQFWAVPSWMTDYVKYDFFQTLTVIGGLLLVVYHGAGDLSVDKTKKEY